MTVCPSCGGVVGQDCFNPQECHEITRAIVSHHQQAVETIRYLEGRIAEMNDVFGEIRRTVQNLSFDGERLEELDAELPWIPVELLQKIEAVMEKEYRQ